MNIIGWGEMMGKRCEKQHTHRSYGHVSLGRKDVTNTQHVFLTATKRGSENLVVFCVSVCVFFSVSLLLLYIAAAGAIALCSVPLFRVCDLSPLRFTHGR